MTTVIPAVAPLPWPARLLPRAADWVPACLYTGVLLDYLVLHYTTLWSAETAVLLAALAVLVASERWEFVRYGEQMPRNVGLRQLLLTMVLIATVVQIDTEGMGPFLYLILPLKAWRWFDRRAGYLMSITVTLIYTATSLYDVITLGLPLNHVASSVILFATASAFVLTISHLAQEDRRARDHAEHLLRALEQSHRELAASAAVAADVAAVAERSRVARDIHDSLGHYLTALNIQLEKALAFQRNDPEETARTLHTAKRLAHDALADVRRSVGLLRSPQAVFSLAGLIHKLATFTGGEPHVVVEIIGDEQQYTVETRLVL